MIRIIFTGVLALLVGACSLKRTADNMERDTEELKHNSRGLKSDSEMLGKRTLDLEAELTFKESSFMMIQNMRYLFGEDDLPETADALPSREPDLPFYAAVVVKSMWFQFWKGDYGDTVEALDERIELGAEILLVRANSYTPYAANVDVLNPDRGWKALAALGSQIHLVRPEYQRAALAHGFSTNMYDLMIEALRVRHEIEPNVRFPRAIAKVNQYAQTAEYLLQLRHNYLPAMVLCMMTDFKDIGTLSRLWMKMVSGRRVDLNRFTPAQLREWTVWLKSAAQTRADLAAIGIKPAYNKMLMGIVASMDFGQNDVLAAGAPSAGSDPVAALRYEFAKAFIDVVGISE